MTNLICAVIVTVATNWVTVSREGPEFVVNTKLGPVVSWMVNQVGQRVTNYVAMVEWKGRTNTVVLESVSDASGERLERSVPEGNGAELFVSPAVITYPDYQPTIHWEQGIPPNWKALPGGVGLEVEN